MSTYILQKDFNWFGTIIPAGTKYVPHGDDHYWPVIDGAHCPSGQLDFYTVKNNPEYFKSQLFVTDISHVGQNMLSGDQIYTFKTDIKIDLKKHGRMIRQAIESILQS